MVQQHHHTNNPNVYLKNFRNEIGRTNIYLTERTLQKEWVSVNFKRNNLFKELNFYPPEVEAELTKLESRYAQIVKDVIKKDLNLDDGHKEILTRFTITLHARNTYKLNYVKEQIVEQLPQRMGAEVGKRLSPMTIEKTADELKRSMLDPHSPYLDSIASKTKVIILENKTKHIFVTSDFPSVEYNLNTLNPNTKDVVLHIFNKLRISICNFEKKIIYILPITPQLTVLISTAIRHENANESVIIDDIEIALLLNVLLISCAQKYLFSSEKICFAPKEKIPEDKILHTLDVPHISYTVKK